MNDTYVEVLIKRKTPIGMAVLRIVTIGATVILGLLGLMGLLPFLIAAVLCGAAAYFVYLNADLEFEYLYVDRQLSIDKVMAKSRRKKADVFDLERMEVLAPISSWRLDEYKNRSYKTVDYSTGTVNQPDTRYVMYFNGEKKVIFEPNAQMIKAIQNIAPRKVFTD
ncbi:MAG: hypothetical protein J6B10_09720 [Lachnospiraceae bacterium]|nr:hypothetical protein [Lachnospiraceae bacterium]